MLWLPVENRGPGMTSAGKILIIDDELTLRQTLARILQRVGFEVTAAETGEQGLAFLETTDFDLVYLDIRMPGLSGLEVLDLIHASHPTLPGCPFYSPAGFEFGGGSTKTREPGITC